MALSEIQINEVATALRESLRHKFNNYNPEPRSMPFHTRLLGKDRLALYSFIHSLNTTFGTAFYEPVAVSLSKTRFKRAKKQADAGNMISELAHKEIQSIMDGLTTAEIETDKETQVERIRKVCRDGKMSKVKLTKIDLMFETQSGELYLFDIKTVKPNKGGFKEFKRTLLEWVAAKFAVNPNAKINTALAIPYNPYEPKPYDRWTMRGMLDLKAELYVAEEFWVVDTL